MGAGGAGRAGLLAGALSVLLGTACASTGATLGSGVGDTLLDRPPFYAGEPAPGVRDGLGLPASTGHLPVAYQRGAADAPIFDPKPTQALRELLDSMTRALDSLGVSRRLVEGGRVSPVEPESTRVPPDVRFGCLTESGDPEADCAQPEGALGRGPQRMLLAVGRPSPGWTAWMGQLMVEAEVTQALVVTLEVGRFRVRQRGLRGAKEVVLGSGHVRELPWLTSLETEVPVLQLTGALVGRDGRAIRIGAEGLVARRTAFRLSALGAQELIGDEDVEALASARRHDLPGQPLVWEAALERLVTGLTGESPATRRRTAPPVDPPWTP